VIFGIGLFLFLAAGLFTAAGRPARAGLFVSCVGLLGLALMVASLCLLIAKVMP
jgi:hypothetical protein